MTTYSLTEEERAKTREYLGYFNLANRYILSSNQPIAVPQQQVLEENMRNILDTYSLTILQGLIVDIDNIRCQIKNARTRLKVSDIAYSMKMNPHEIYMLWEEDYKLCERLAHLLAVPLYWHPTGRGLVPGNGTDIPIIGSF